MSAKRNRLNKRFWQAGCPGFLTKILNDIDKCWCYRILHKEILELFSSSAAGLVSVDCTVWHRASWVCVLSWIVGEFTAWQPLVQVCPDLCGDVVLFTVQWWTRAAESHRELPSCRSAPESCHMLITVSLPSSKLWTGSWQKLLLYIQIGFRCSKEVDLATYKKKKPCNFFPWKNTVKALHTLVSSLSNSEKVMNILDLHQLGVAVTCPTGGWVCLPWKSDLEGYLVRIDLGLFSKPDACLGCVLAKGSCPRDWLGPGIDFPVNSMEGACKELFFLSWLFVWNTTSPVKIHCQYLAVSLWAYWKQRL